MNSTERPLNLELVSGRLRFLDGLRGVAVLLVMFAHFAEGISVDIKEINSNYFQIGQSGVTLFFLISGYIIPRSLKSARSLKIFWLNRFFRLYPVYWLSIIAALALFASEMFKLPVNLTTGGVIANFTMLQGFVGIENVIGVFWSLKFEMMFYFAMTAIAVTRLTIRPFMLVATYSIAVILLAFTMRLLLGKFFAYGMFHLELMLVGWALGEWHSEKMSNWKACVIVALCVVAAGVSAYTAFAGRLDTSGAGTLSLTPMLSAWIGSLVFFVVCLTTSKAIRWPWWLAQIGTISYSAYLFHTLIMAATSPILGSYGYLSIAAWFGLTIAVSWISYWRLELPLIGVGKHLAKDALTKSDGVVGELSKT